MAKATKNLHVPLPEPLYAELRLAAQNAGRPATEIARDAIGRWLAEQRRSALRAAIAEYARASAGTEADLDRDLERATIEHLRAETKKRKRSR
jgi:hypothetical protein